jgi:hypothetical protein
MSCLYSLLPARPHDIQSLEALLEEFEGIQPADKGFIDAFKKYLLLKRHRILALTPPRKNMKTEPLLKFCKLHRQKIKQLATG